MAETAFRAVWSALGVARQEDYIPSKASTYTVYANESATSGGDSRRSQDIVHGNENTALVLIEE